MRFTDRFAGASYELSEINASIDLEALDRPLNVTGDVVWNGQKAALDLTLGTISTITACAETAIDLPLTSDIVAVAFKGALVPLAANAPVKAGGAFSVSTTYPAAVMAWAVGEANPALIGLSNLSVEGNVAVDAIALAVDIKGGVARDGQDASL